MFSAIGYDLFTKIGYYVIFIPVWVLLILVVAVILEFMYDLFISALGILFFIGLFLIFSDHSLAGLASLGIFGYIIILIILTGFVSLLVTLIPGIIAGIYTVIALSDSGDFSIIAGIIVFIIVTSLIWTIISRILIPFSVGFWIGMVTANLASIIASSLFVFQRLPTLLDFGDSSLNSPPSDLSQLFEWAEDIVTYLLDYVLFQFEHFMFITIICILMGILMVVSSIFYSPSSVQQPTFS
jgi:hypothetical protein